MTDYIPVNEPLLNGNEKKYLIECIESGWISSEGPFVAKFEQEFALKMGRKYGIAVANGTAAIDASIEALGIRAGDEVILPAFTIISCVNQIIRNGGKPVLVDSDPLTWNMNVEQIEKKITKKTKAIMIVHIYGLPVDIDPIIEIANRFDLKIIEDASQMHGQYYKNRPCGSFGDVSTFSFYPNKHITTGEGGMILTDDENIANECRSLRNLCFQPSKRFVHEKLGWNLRMTNLQAAIGLAQLERLDEFVVKKRRNGEIYNSLLKDVAGIQLPLHKNNYAESIYWVYGVILDENLGLDAEEMMRMLAKENIGTRPFFCPINKQPVLNRMGYFIGEEYPVAEKMYRYGFYLPSGLGINEKQIEAAAISLKKLLS